MRILLLLCSAVLLQGAKKTLEVHTIEVEGGKAVLIVAPSGESMLNDVG